MLSIQPQQYEALSDHAWQRFVADMVQHTCDFSPELASALAPSALVTAVRSCVDTARSLGLSTRGSVRLHLEMSLLFGSSYMDDPQYPWAGRLLRSDLEEMQRAQALYLKVLDYQDKVSGSEGQHTLAALRGMTLLPDRAALVTEANFVDRMRDELALAHPHKAAHVGRSALESLVHKAKTEALRTGFVGTRPQVMLAALMFMMGAGCMRDPFYPWIAASLVPHRAADAELRARQLEKKAQTWLRGVIARFSEAPKP